MTPDDIQAIAGRFAARGVRYLIVGGIAVVAHGYLRFTADLDLVLDLERGNVEQALATLGELGYRPRPPVPLADFADPVKREAWTHDKGLVVFSLWNPERRHTEVDLFVRAPFDFEAAYRRRLEVEIGEGIKASVIGLQDLLAMKKSAGRPRDLDDIEHLREAASR